jgi:hypothetical protein
MSEQYEQRAAATGLGEADDSSVTWPRHEQSRLAETPGTFTDDRVSHSDAVPMGAGPDEPSPAGGQGMSTQQMIKAATEQERQGAQETGTQVRGRAGPATQQPRGQAGTRQHRLAEGPHTFADRQPGRLLEEVRDYARRHPGTFLLGALAAGLVLGWLTRNMAFAQAAARGRSPGR